MATIFWYFEGILLMDYKGKRVSIIGEYYASILELLQQAKLSPPPRSKSVSQ